MDTVDPKTQQRIRVAVVAVLTGLAVATLVSWGADVWPAALVRQAQLDWFGRVSMRGMFAGIFATYGLVLVAALVPAVVARLIYDRVRAPRAGQE